jgi:hypothetical protein
MAPLRHMLSQESAPNMLQHNLQEVATGSDVQNMQVHNIQLVLQFIAVNVGVAALCTYFDGAFRLADCLSASYAALILHTWKIS